jgi:hypothetical protein
MGRSLTIPSYRKASFSVTLTFAIDDRRLVIRLGCVDGWAASVLVSESVRSASLRQIHSLVLQGFGVPVAVFWFLRRRNWQGGVGTAIRCL